jgi:hypothetical protein
MGHGGLVQLHQQIFAEPGLDIGEAASPQGISSGLPMLDKIGVPCWRI